MTPDQRTHEALLKIFAAKDAGLKPGLALAGIMCEAIRQAEAEMKERCAQVADLEETEQASTFNRAGEAAANRIAEQIRALD